MPLYIAGRATMVTTIGRMAASAMAKQTARTRGGTLAITAWPSRT
jgi:hypothetical protein